MRPEEGVLFLIVTVLSFALVAAVVAPLVRKKRPAPDAPPHESPARPVSGFVVPGAMEGPRCPTCRRSLLAGFRFCPFDGTSLVADATVARPVLADPGGVPRRICPRCARAYRQETAVCEHDGIPLVPVN